MIISADVILWFLLITLVSLVVGASNTDKRGYPHSKQLDKVSMVTFYLGSVATIVSAAVWIFEAI